MLPPTRKAISPGSLSTIEDLEFNLNLGLSVDEAFSRLGIPRLKYLIEEQVYFQDYSDRFPYSIHNKAGMFLIRGVTIPTLCCFRDVKNKLPSLYLVGFLEIKKLFGLKELLGCISCPDCGMYYEYRSELIEFFLKNSEDKNVSRVPNKSINDILKEEKLLLEKKYFEDKEYLFEGKNKLINYINLKIDNTFIKHWIEQALNSIIEELEFFLVYLDFINIKLIKNYTKNIINICIKISIIYLLIECANKKKFIKYIDSLGIDLEILKKNVISFFGLNEYYKFLYSGLDNIYKKNKYQLFHSRIYKNLIRDIFKYNNLGFGILVAPIIAELLKNSSSRFFIYLQLE